MKNTTFIKWKTEPFKLICFSFFFYEMTQLLKLIGISIINLLSFIWEDITLKTIIVERLITFKPFLWEYTNFYNKHTQFLKV